MGTLKISMHANPTAYHVRISPTRGTFTSFTTAIGNEIHYFQKMYHRLEPLIDMVLSINQQTTIIDSDQIRKQQITVTSSSQKQYML